MRFAYIDSQGNEVPIPSVEALALRIELGAIGPETQLYDAAADRWGPAHTHEIYLSLSRAQDEGFVAPPPPAAPTPPSEGSDGQGGESGASGVSEQAEEEPPPSGETAEDEEVSERDADVGSDDVLDVTAGLGLTLTELGPPDEAATGQAPDVSPDSPPPAAEEPAGAEEESPKAEGFDFGAMDLLEFEKEPEADDESAAAPGRGWATEEPVAEGEMDFSAPAVPFGDGMDFEKPMSEFDPESPPAWMEEGGAPAEGETDDDVPMDLSPLPPASFGSTPTSPPPSGDRSEGGEDRGRPPPRPRPVPRSRPSPPRRPRKRFPVGALVGVVTILALGVAGWYAWSTYQARLAEARAAAKAAERPPVTLPQIPAALMGPMRKLGDGALARTIGRLRAEEASFGLPAAPREAWLGGDYLANPKRYPDIPRYWMLVDSFVDHVRETDAEVFHEEYVAELDSAGIKGHTATVLLARADSGFLATRAARIEAYDEMDDLTNASLDLHEFLLDHQGDISYEPAAGGVSKDPVLEAVPKTKQLGTRMWTMVDRITGALNDLGIVDKVTTEHLSAALFDKIRTAGFK